MISVSLTVVFFHCRDVMTGLISVFLLQDTNEIVAIKKFKDSEGKRALLSRWAGLIREHL